MKKRNTGSHRSLLSLLMATILVLSMVLSLCACTSPSGQEESSEPPETESVPDETEAPALVLDGTVVLYFNLNREKYDGKAEDALTSRPKGKDGYFHVETSNSGAIGEVLVGTRMLTNKFDTNDVVGLVFDENNLVTAVYTVAEMGGAIVANRYFVTSAEGDSVVVNTNNTGSGEEISFTTASDVAIYDVSDPESGYGEVTALEEMDQIFAVQNTAGEVSHIWVLSRASQRVGHAGCICGANDSGAPHLEGCDGTMLYVWQPWTNNTTLPSSDGYWYLDTEDKEVHLDAYLKFISNVDLYIDLNGHTVYSPTIDDNRIFHVIDDSTSANITILDSAGGGKFVMQDRTDVSDLSGTSIQGVFILLANGRHTFTMYGGTIDGSGLTGSSGHGGLIRSVKQTVNIHGGEIIGARNTKTGAAIWCSGVLNMTGGTIRDGYANMKGGNVYIQKEGTFNMSGGEILNGKADIAGGNLAYEAGAAFNQTGGTISGGTAPSDPEILINPAASG